MSDRIAAIHILYQQGRYERAEQELRRLLESEPESSRALALLAHCLAAQGKGALARGAALEALRLAPNWPHAHYTLSWVERGRGRFSKAIVAIGRALELEPEEPSYWHCLGLIELQKLEFEKALAAARRGLAFDPTHLDCLLLRGDALWHLGRTAEMAAVARRVLALNPENVAAMCFCGWHELECGDARLAIVNFQEALRLRPHDPSARAGYLESLRARYPVYRRVMRFLLRFGKLPGLLQFFAALTTALVAMFLVRQLQLEFPDHLPPRAPAWAFAGTLFLMYCGLAAGALALVRLRLDRFGARLLVPVERRATEGILGGLATAVVAAAAGLAGWGPGFAVVAALFVVAWHASMRPCPDYRINVIVGTLTILLTAAASVAVWTLSDVTVASFTYRTHFSAIIGLMIFVGYTCLLSFTLIGRGRL